MFGYFVDDNVYGLEGDRPTPFALDLLHDAVEDHPDVASFSIFSAAFL